MDLPYEYFKSKTHIIDLQKLKDNEIYFIIRSFYNEKENFNKMEGFNFKKTLINPCNKTKELFKDLRYILNGYIDVINENDLSFYSKTDIERLLIQMDKIELEIKSLMAVRILKNKVNSLVDVCLLNIRVFYSLLSDFIFSENHLWEELN